MQCQLIRLIVSIVFLLIDAIDYVDPIKFVDRINRINPGILNYSALQLKDNSNNPTNAGMNFWGQKGQLFEVNGIYWHLQIIYEVCLINK